MTVTVDIYVDNVKVMTAVATNGSATLGTVADVANLKGIYAKSGSNTLDNQRGIHEWPGAKLTTHTKPPHWPAWHGLVTVHATSGANASKRSIQTKIINDDGSTSLTMRDKWPFTD